MCNVILYSIGEGGGVSMCIIKVIDVSINVTINSLSSCSNYRILHIPTSVSGHRDDVDLACVHSSKVN